MKERTYVYRIDFEILGGYDCGFELIEARTTDEAISLFREKYSFDKYMISDVLRRIGKDAGLNVWAMR